MESMLRAGRKRVAHVDRVLLDPLVLVSVHLDFIRRFAYRTSLLLSLDTHLRLVWRRIHFETRRMHRPECPVTAAVVELLPECPLCRWQTGSMMTCCGCVCRSRQPT